MKTNSSKLRKGASLMLALLVVLSFAACTTGGPAVDGTDSSVVSSAAEGSAPVETPDELVKIVHVKAIWGDKPIDDPSNEVVRKAISEKLGIELVVVGQQNPADQNEKPRLMIASGEQIDVINVVDWTSYKRDEVIIPLQDYLNTEGKDILEKSDPISIKNRTDADGNIWAVPYEQNPVSISLLMRKDWLDELSLQAPTTLDEFESVMLTFKEKKNSEGFVQYWDTMIDTSNPTIAFAGTLEQAFAGAFLPNGETNWLDPADGKLKPCIMHPEYKKFLAKMADWYQKGVLHPEIMTMQYQQANDIFNGGQSACTFNWLSSLDFNISTGKPANPDFDLVGLVPPKGEQPGMYKSDLPPGWASVITKSCKNPDIAMKYMNYTMATDEGFLLSTYGVKDSQWVWADEANGIISYPDGANIADMLSGFGGETSFTSGWLFSMAQKYSPSLRDKQFILDLNDPAKVPTKYADDFGVVYDISTMQSKDLQGSLYDLLKEARASVIMGRQPVDSWDAFLADWLEKGGSQWVDDLTAQYNAAHGIA